MIERVELQLRSALSSWTDFGDKSNRGPGDREMENENNHPNALCFSEKEFTKTSKDEETLDISSDSGQI